MSPPIQRPPIASLSEQLGRLASLRLHIVVVVSKVITSPTLSISRE
jgi:hypothetical protein